MPYPNRQYTLEVKHWPTILDNMKDWQMFGNDKQFEKFLQSKYEFEDNSIDLVSKLENQIVLHSNLER